jgi:hypothetical protein
MDQHLIDCNALCGLMGWEYPQGSVVWCGVVWCGVAWCGVVWWVVWCGFGCCGVVCVAVWCSAVWAK